MLYKTNKSVTVTKTEKEMNANELADAMDTHGFRYHHVKKAVAMLRQQQAEIEALKAKLAYMFEQEIKSAGVYK